MDESLKAGAGIAWDSSTPMLAVGANKAVKIYRFPTVLWFVIRWQINELLLN